MIGPHYLDSLPVFFPSILHALGGVDVARDGVHEAEVGDGRDLVQTREHGGQADFQGLKKFLSFYFGQIL